MKRTLEVKDMEEMKRIEGKNDGNKNSSRKPQSRIADDEEGELRYVGKVGKIEGKKVVQRGSISANCSTSENRDSDMGTGARLSGYERTNKLLDGSKNRYEDDLNKNEKDNKVKKTGFLDVVELDMKLCVMMLRLNVKAKCTI